MTDVAASIDDVTEGRPPALEVEPPARLRRAAMQVDGGWWSAAWTVPEDDSGVGLLTLTRHGDGCAADTTLELPATELPALATLVAGLAGVES